MRRSIILLFCGLLSWASLASAGHVSMEWNPSERATHYRAYYGLASRDYQTMLETGQATQASISGLEEGTTYFFAVTALNEAGESSYSDEASVQIAPTDITPPTIAITFPHNGDDVRRRRLVTIRAEAQDVGGLREVRFMVNGSRLCTDLAPPYTCPWYVGPQRHQTYTLTAQAIDVAGHQASDTISIESR